MTIISVDRLSAPSKDHDNRTAEVNFDGRQIGTISGSVTSILSGETQAKLEILKSANPEDVRTAGLEAMGTHQAASLYAYVEQMFQQELLRDRSLRRMRSKLKKNTLYSTPGEKLQAIARPYCESVRSYIKQNHPEAVILNTLSEEEAFRHYLTPR
jgi:hypothetical protein